MVLIVHAKNLLENQKIYLLLVVMKSFEDYFYFCWEVVMCVAIGYHSPRHWHSESHCPEIADLQKRKYNLVNSVQIDPLTISQIKEIDATLEKLIRQTSFTDGGAVAIVGSSCRI